ncbi:hypothetical protein WJU16_24345 [Chitinophaga pollutisoli]|uniref:Uncharacterized protein n=1 Tax=Chitinophaga pollutisoli TaxID=3133966 RepID=A0ABZ2YNY6_9BACT
MQSRILLISPSGPLCFIDYSTIDEGMAVLEQMKRTVNISRLTSMIYEFRLFRMIQDSFVGIDHLLLPRFDRKSIDIFLDSCYRATRLQ